MKKVLLLIFISFYTLIAQSYESDLFKNGNDAYLKNDFASAIKFYSQLVHQDYQSGELFFNLGNAYYKTDSISNAILYYEKALQCSPNDADVKVNLKMANLKTIDKMEAREKLIFLSWWDSFVNSKTADKWSAFAIFFLLITSILLIVFRMANSSGRKQFFFISAAAVFLLAMFFLLLAYSNDAYQNNHQSAILFSSSASIKSAPTENAKDLFILHEGAKLYILAKENAWYRVRIENGNEGWVPETSVRII